VAVPKSHRIGSTGSSFFQRLLTWTDDRLKLDPSSLRLLEQEWFWTDVQTSLRAHDTGERTALVFIHGYHVSFEEAALRAAQIGFDLQVTGLTAFFSWPSRGTFVDYIPDGDSIEASEQAIADFLTCFANDSGADRVHVIAHSMGNRGLLRSMQRIVAQASGAGAALFGQIILAAPDVDSDVFRQLAGDCCRSAQRTTLYISSRDKALASSGIIHRAPRAGYWPPVTVLPGIDTVEVSNIDLTWLGHGYVAEARDILTDIHALFLHNDPPQNRMGMRAKVSEAGDAYWVVGS
jgi:esterase/lipase superfamily enzyme